MSMSCEPRALGGLATAAAATAGQAHTQELPVREREQWRSTNDELVAHDWESVPLRLIILSENHLLTD